MYAVEVYASVRQFVFLQGRGQREDTRVFGLSRETIGKICRFSLRPGYTRAFSELVSHYLFSDRFGRPGKGNDKG